MSKVLPLWDDFNHFFKGEQSYIVLFDDANKSIQNLNYLLSTIDKQKTFSIKVIVTSRDYVKKQVANSLSNHLYEEVVLSDFKDEEISQIIVNVLPNLKYHNDIKRKIVELAKGNARIALMATYSITLNSEANYLDSPVLLYEKYFKKISDEIGIFDNPVILKSLAIVSFFGVVDKNNEELRISLSTSFQIDWNEFWSAIMELHSHEIVDVYSNDIVKVSDQVLATYAFYKCFIYETTAVLNYAQWITEFMQRFPHRIRTTLIDANNTFGYDHVKSSVLPHLNRVSEEVNTDEQSYSFYSLFWFYKGLDCLLYLKRWIESLPQEMITEEELIFSYDHNSHTSASKYFDLLKDFWRHEDELLKPSLEITLDLLAKQPSRLPEVLKFIDESFKYNLKDRDYGYQRQNLLLDVLLDKNLNKTKIKFANGIFLHLIESLLGWHFTEYGSKGHSISICNFDLYKSEELLALRTRILKHLYLIFDTRDNQVQKILNRIVYPGGDIDENIYVNELPIYQKIISEKLDTTQYYHCRFVKKLSKHLLSVGSSIPENWRDFIDSNIMKLSSFLRPGWEYRDDKSIEESEKEKREEFEHFIQSKNWVDIEEFLVNINNLYLQQRDNKTWHIESAVTDIYIAISNKGKEAFKSALRLFFSGRVSFLPRTTVIHHVLSSNILTGDELLNVMRENDFKGKTHWTSVLLLMLPETQINREFLEILIDIFQSCDREIFIFHMRDYVKYNTAFEDFKKGKANLDNHNIITYLTTLILAKPKDFRNFGYHFCSDCAPYFTQHISLLKKVYLNQKQQENNYFDHDGKELAAVLNLDNNFFLEFLRQKPINNSYLSFKLEDFKLDFLWSLSNYEKIIEEAMNIIIDKSPLFSNWDHPANKLFTFHNNPEDYYEKTLIFLENYMMKYIHNTQNILVVLNIVIHRYNTDFLAFLKKFLILNKDVEVFRQIHLDKGGLISGSRIPITQGKIDFCHKLINAIKDLSNILDYSEHIDYLEKKILWLKKDITREQRREFEEEYY